MLLTPSEAAATSGYPPSCTVLAIHTNGAVAGAVIDTNSDGQWLVFDLYWFDERTDRWAPGYSCGAGSFGCGHGRTSWICGRGAPGDTVTVRYRARIYDAPVSESGWWFYVWADPDWQDALPPQLVSGDST